MSITSRSFGFTSRGQAVTAWSMVSPAGATAEVLDFGGILRSLTVADRAGNMRNVALGFDTVAEYEVSTTYAGAIVGRHAGRIGGGRFTLNGVDYQLDANDGPNHLHGGVEGFSSRVWEAEADCDRLILRLTSPDGDQGYPGTVTVTAVYEWLDGSTLGLTLEAVSDRDTVLSLTHHGYWNMAGEGSVGDNLFQVHAPTFAAADGNCLANGRLPSVEGTPFDFRQPAAVRQVWEGEHPQLLPGVGIDHTFPVPGEGLRELGSLYSPAAGVKLTIASTLPALHIYSGVTTHAALEAQFIPNSLHNPHFPSAMLPAGKKWFHHIQYQFSTQ